MAQLIISAAAATAGFMIGGPTGASIGWAVGSALGSAMFPTKLPDQNYAQPIMDLRVTGGEYGQPIPYVQGHPAIAGQVWWNTDKRAHTTTTSTTSGGKGSEPEQTTTTSTTTYDMDMLIGLTDNEIVGIARIWWNGELIWTSDSGATAGSIAASNTSARWTRMTVYTGSASQLPDPTYEAAVTTALAPAYRGRGYVFIEGLQLGASGQIPNLTFEVSTAGTLIATSWNGNDKTRGVTLSNGDLTATLAFNGSMVRTVAKGATAEKVFQAFTVTTVGNLVFGFVKDVAPLTVTTGNTYLGSGALMTFSSGTTGNNTVDITVDNTGVSGYSNGDAGAIALDLVNGKAWLQKNGTYFNSGDPAAGTNPQWTWTPNAFLYGLIVRQDGGTGGVLVLSPGTPPSGFSLLRNSDPAAFVRYIRMKNFTDSSEAGSGASISEIMLLSGTTDVTPTAGVQCPYVSSGSHPTGGSLDPTLRLVNKDTMEEEFTWNTTIIGSSDFYLKFIFASDAATGPDGIKFAREKYVNKNIATSLDVEGSYDDVTYTAMANLTAIPDETAGDYSEVYDLNPIGAPGTSATEPIITLADEDLADVVSRLCLRAGLTAGQIDVTNLSSITRNVRSLAVSQIASTRSTLELLMSAFFFECVLSGSTIKFVSRGGSSAVSIPYLDLGASMGDDTPEPLALKEVNDLEIPAQIALSYINVNDDYQTDTQYSDRLVSSAAGTVTAIQMAIGLTPSEAKGIVDTILLDQVASRWSTKIDLLGDYCYLEATDPVTVTGPDGTSHRLRLVKKTDAYPLLTYDAVVDDVSVLSSQGITSSDYTSSTVVAAPVNTLMELMDIPMLRDADDDPGVYVAAKGDGNTYPGSNIYSSPDNVTYTLDATVTESAIFGTCTTTLGNWTNARIVDELNSVTVNVDDTLSSSTRAAVLGDQTINAILIGTEIIQFITATLSATGIYVLSRLIRGSRGTEWAMTGHAASERCVLLRTAGLRRVPRLSSDIGVARYYKGVTGGRAVSTATPELFMDNAVALKPFSPFDLRAVRDASSGVLSWAQLPMPAVYAWIDIAWNGSVYCAISTGQATATSPDGVTWTLHLAAMPSSASWKALAWNGTVFCAVAYGSDKAATSADGITWTARTLTSSDNWIDIAANGTIFATISEGTPSGAGATAAATSSNNGASWTARTLPTTAHWKAIAGNGTTFLAIAGGSLGGGTEPGGGNYAATSTDGVAWAAQTLPNTSRWCAIAVKGSEFCVVSELAHAAFTTTGATYTPIVTLPYVSFNLVGASSTLWCVVSNGTTFLTSTDGTAWAQQTSLPTHLWTAIASDGTNFCAVTSTVTGGDATLSQVITSTNSENDVTFAWQRRSRFTTRTIGTAGIGIPLGEDTEAYEIDIYSDGTYTTVVRTITTTTTTASYTAAQQIADGLTPGNTVYARVYQLNATVGRGYALEASV